MANRNGPIRAIPRLERPLSVNSSNNAPSRHYGSSPPSTPSANRLKNASPSIPSSRRQTSMSIRNGKNESEGQ